MEAIRRYENWCVTDLYMHVTLWFLQTFAWAEQLTVMYECTWSYEPSRDTQTHVLYRHA